MESSTQDSGANTRRPLVAKEPTFVVPGYNGSGLVEQILLELGWKKLADKNSEGFVLKWVENRNSINYDTFREGEQMVNRIPNCFLLTNKLGLLTSLQHYERVWTKLNLGRITKLRTSDFIPETYRLNDFTERRIFFEIFNSKDIWICKPTGMNQGRGIFLVRDLEEFRKFMNEREELDKKQQRNPVDRVIQRYIMNPLLIEGKKFDIRVFMLVASTSPFLVLFHKGYVRLCLQTYNNQTDDLVAHLTNQFVQKRDASYEFFKEDTVWSIEKLNSYINKKIAPVKGLENDWVYNTLTKQIKQIMLYCFHSVKQKLKSKIGYFDLYGLDFLIDENMKVWLIEVNANPCLATNCGTLKEVIPAVVRESLYLAIECFEKSRRGLPLYPLQTLRNFQILFNGGHSNAYLNLTSPSLKRSWSLVSPVLCRSFSARDSSDQEDEKLAADISRNYTTSVVFTPYDEHNVSSSPVSMFDLKKIEARKLFAYRSDFPNYLSSSPRSMPSLTQNSSATNSHFTRNKPPNGDRDVGNLPTKAQIPENFVKDPALLADELTNKKSTSVTASKNQTSDKDCKEETTLQESCSDKTGSQTSNKDSTVLEKSSKSLGITNHLGTERIPERLSRDHTSSEAAAINDGKTFEKLSADKVKSDFPDADKKIRLLDISFDQPSKKSSEDKATPRKGGNREPSSERPSKGQANAKSEQVQEKSVREQTPTNSQLKDQTNIHKSKGALVSDKFSRGVSAWEKSKSQTAQRSSDYNVPAHLSSPLLFDFSGPRSPSRTEPPTNEFSFSRTMPGVNAAIRPIQLLPFSQPHHDKKNGPLDLIIEQLERDLAIAKFQQSTEQPLSNYRLINADVNLVASAANLGMLNNYPFLSANQETSYNSAHEPNKKSVPETSSQPHFTDRSKTFLSRIFPQITLNFLPAKEKKSYLSPSMLSAYSIGNIPNSEQIIYQPAEVENSSLNHKPQVQKKLKDRKPGSEAATGRMSAAASVSDRPSTDRHTEVTIEKKSWELKGQMLFKEMAKNALREVMNSPVQGQNTYPGTWNKIVPDESSVIQKDLRASLSATRLRSRHLPYTSHGMKRIFPDPDVWLAGFHKSLGASNILQENQMTSSKLQNSNPEKDWGHFTVVSPK